MEVDKKHPLKLKSLEEILVKAQDVIQRHRRKFIRRSSRPCPDNCVYATVVGNSRVTGCPKCGSHNPQKCRNTDTFQPVNSKEELYNEFQAILRDPEALWQDYRDIVVFFWVLGIFDPIDDGVLDEQLIKTVEKKS